MRQLPPGLTEVSPPTGRRPSSRLMMLNESQTLVVLAWTVGSIVTAVLVLSAAALP